MYGFFFHSIWYLTFKALLLFNFILIFLQTLEKTLHGITIHYRFMRFERIVRYLP